MSIPFIEENDQTQARHEHLFALKKLVGNAYPNKFERSQIIEPGREDTVSTVVEKFRAFEPKTPGGERPVPEEIELANKQLNPTTIRLAGRIASPPRVMGKAAFVHISDGLARLQIYVKRADAKGISNDAAGIEVDGWELFSLLDHGDFIGVEGYLFITKTGELSIHVQRLQFLAKALLPMPDKMHGIHDPEIRQRQRYADLIAGSLKIDREEGELSPRDVFERRSAIIREMRRILDDHGYVEVETPMLTSKATGAAARPFKTHHNALDIDLYARIAPELYLKRLLVGGFEKVYELNRNFRNEGIDRTHNPEFTMLEFYWAYADVNQMMDFCEQVIRTTVFKALGHTHVRFGELDIDFSQPFGRMTMKEAVEQFGGGETITNENLVELFEQHVEQNLVQPTLISDFPKPISPLSKASPSDPTIAERFELFIAGMECANGFSELNDPKEQFDRFNDQMLQRERGDEEAMVMDEDYIRALSYGMPPAAGIGIGIDRFVMLLTNRTSIRDVLLFPHMRPERKPGELQPDEESDIANNGP
ncbi:MAG TPA: lysine--tRNA ligase [Pyrinomonadaceae bacterium]|nr:lysine--tRNA ligase [Pyrinomonadaceae bacterium]